MAGKVTPVMKQHAAAKAAHPDCVIFFRLGDFYEMFGEDAVLVAEVLDLTLTSRNKGKPDEIPMAGIPHHAAHGYIARMLSQGYRVAICEQMADPKTVKGIVPREVVRVLTKGTWSADGELPKGANNWLCALEFCDEGVGVALLDLSTAELLATTVPDLASVLSELGRARPAEIIISPGEGTQSVLSVLEEVARGAHTHVGAPLSQKEAKRALTGIDFGLTLTPGARASARALSFAKECFKGRAFPVLRVSEWNQRGVLELDSAAQRHLELSESTSGDEKATLLAVLDRTKSPGGARLLKRRLLSPLMDPDAINRRLDAVGCLVDCPRVRSKLADPLSRVGDLERLVVRATQQEAHPRDLGHVRRGLFAAQEIATHLDLLPQADLPESFGFREQVEELAPLREILERALVERPPAQAKEGAVFRDGFDPQLDELSALRLNGSERLTALETELRVRTGISNLRVKYTRVFGWYVEVGRAHAGKVPADFQRKQTVAGGERFTLQALDDLAEDVQSADERFRARELSLLSELVLAVAEKAQQIHRLTAKLSELDVYYSLAELAVEHDYTRPIVDESETLFISQGRHPVVERLSASGAFVPNDTKLEIGSDHLWLISGPNMAGKSTFLRQVALIVILAQMGSYVPAKSAHIGVVDRLLSRVGASDNLAGGESTFMVEMRETANILRSATRRSFVILDEVGRGTSTFDGLAIAWAVAEHLDEVVGCRALFATHYHELSAFADASATASNHSVSVREHEGDVVFLHQVALGPASRSYGVFVAKLANVPESVLARSRSILATLEGAAPHAGLAQKGMGSAPLVVHAKSTASPGQAEVLATLAELDPDRMSGIEALQLLHQLKKRLS